MNENFTGTGVALITPFNKDKTINFDHVESVVEHVIKGGVDFLVPLGSTGESATLNEEEQRRVLDKVITVNNGRKPILAGNFGGNNTLDLVAKIKGYNFDGIDGVLSSSPAYVKPSQEGIYAHYMEVQKVCPVPIIIYNVPGRTRSNIEWETTVRLAQDAPKIVGIKEASGDLIQTTRIIKNKPEHFLVSSGDDEVALPMIACGGNGVISVIANSYPSETSSMTNAALKNDFPAARKLNEKLYDLHKWLYIEGNPVGIKSAMQILGLCDNHVRLPLHNMSDTNYGKLKEAMADVSSL